jgi:hypothetical protein
MLELYPLKTDGRLNIAASLCRADGLKFLVFFAPQLIHGGSHGLEPRSRKLEAVRRQSEG